MTYGLPLHPHEPSVFPGRGLFRNQKLRRLLRMVPVGERLQGADHGAMDIIQEGCLPLLLLQRDAGNSPDSRVKLLDDKSCANILKAGRIAVKRAESKRKRLGASYTSAKTRRNFTAYMKK